MGHTEGRWSKVDAFMPHEASLLPTQESAYVKNSLYVILARGPQFQLVVMLYYYGTTTNRSPNNFSLTSAAAVIF